MSDWGSCQACGLKHRVRADQHCPRCGQPLDAAARAAPPDAAPPPPVEPPDLNAPAAAASAAWVPPPLAPAPPDQGFPLGARVAGWVLLANAGLNLLTWAKLGGGLEPGFRGGLAGAMVVDLVMAGALIGGRTSWRRVALVRVVLGLVVLTPLAWWNGGAFAGGVQLAFSLGLVLLLAGRPGPGRLAGGLVPAAGALVLAAAVLLVDGMAGAARGLAADLADGGRHAARLEGGAEGWRLPLPGDHWHEQPSRPAGIDRSATWPEEDAVVMVAAPPVVAGAAVDLERAAAALVGAARERDATFTELGRRRLLTRRGAALAVHARTAGKAGATEGWYVVHLAGGKLGMVFAIAPAGRPVEVDEELLAVAGALDL